MKTTQKKRHVPHCWLLLASLLTLFSAGNSSGQGVFQLTAAGELMAGTNALAIEIAGDHVYLASSAGMIICQKSNPTNLIEVGRYPLTNQNFRVQVLNNIAYLSKKKDGLELVDVSDPSRPVRIGGCDTPGDASAFMIWDRGIGLLADGDAGLLTIDISEPSDPKIVSRLETGGTANDVVNVYNYVLLANGMEGLEALNMDDPFHPQVIAKIPTENALRLHVMGRMGAGNYAYLADGAGGIKVFGLAFGQPLKFLSSFQTGGAARSVYNDGFMLYIATADSGIRSVEVGRPENPAGGGGFHLSDDMTDASVSGDYLYATGSKVGLRVFKIHYSAQPRVTIMQRGKEHQLSWGYEGEAYQLEAADSLGQPLQWKAVENSATLNGNAFELILPNFGQAFYRLKKQR
jgi:hypothetical protein